MSVPVLFAVDEDADSLHSVERELVDRYSRGYRVRLYVVGGGGGGGALGA